MVRLTRIYTRGGDHGLTSLGDGSRVAKQALRVEAYGTVDEANAVLGMARLHTAAWPEADAMLARIQNDLFDLGADLCTPLPPASSGASAFPDSPESPSAPAPSGAATGKAAGRLGIVGAQVMRLEREIDQVNGGLAPLASFVLPGGTPAAATLHVARTVVRRAERLVAALAVIEPVSADALIYLNRLSDHLFVLARAFNARGSAGGTPGKGATCETADGAGGDILWVPGGNRG